MKTMKAMKFKIDSPEHSKQIQKRLFEMGYKWLISEKEFVYTDRKCLYTTEKGVIYLGNNVNGDNVQDCVKTTLSDISPWQPKQGEIIEVSQNGEEWVTREFLVKYDSYFLCLNISLGLMRWIHARPLNPTRKKIEELEKEIERLKMEL